MATNTKQINISLSQEQFEKIKEKAEKSLRSVSNFVVFCALEYNDDDNLSKIIKKNED